MDLVAGMRLDYLQWDNTQAVQLEYSRRPCPPADPAAATNADRDLIAVAKKQPATQKDILAGVAAYGAQDCVFLLPGALVPEGRTVKRGDVVETEDGTRWTVIESMLRRQGATWRLSCRDLVLAYELRDSIDVLRATQEIGANGVRAKLYPPQGGQVLYAGLPARAQPQAEEVADARGVRGGRTRYTVVVGRQISVDPAEDVVRLEDGTILDIVSYQEAERIDALPSLTCERRP